MTRPSRSATARTKVPNARPGATRSSNGGRHAPGRLPRGRFTRELLRRRRSSSAAPRLGRRLRRHARAHGELHSSVADDPERSGGARAQFPWIAFEGRWGELQQAFFNGPTGPNLKDQWTDPILWSRGLARPRLFGADGRLFGTAATDFFCSAVATGSRGLVGLLRSPGLTLLVLAALLALLIFGATRTSWRPPLRIASPVGEPGARPFRPPAACTSSGRALPRDRLAADPARRCISIVQALVLGGFGSRASTRPAESAGALVLSCRAIGTVLTLLGLALVQAATARALVELDQGGRSGPCGPTGSPSEDTAAARRTCPRRLAWCPARRRGPRSPSRSGWPVLGADRSPSSSNCSALGGLRRSMNSCADTGSTSLIVGVGAVVTIAAGPLLGAL